MQQTPQQFLRDTPRGAYTTLCVQGGSLLLDWPMHLERLIRSLKALHEAVAGFYDAYYSWLETAAASEPAALQQLVAPAIRAALASAQQADAAAGDLMLIVVLAPAPGQPCGLDVCVHAQRCGPLDSGPGTAVVLGGPRSVAEAKDSGWVAERQPLEQQRPSGAAEVLLSTEDGRLLEGLVTNLFVVTESSAPDAAGSSDGSPVVWTAGVREGVVWGTARARVLEACRQLGIAVREEAPSSSGRLAWREAFLTNSLRRVQPLHTISCGAGNVWGHAAWEVRFPAAPGPVTAALRAAMLALLPTCDAADL